MSSRNLFALIIAAAVISITGAQFISAQDAPNREEPDPSGVLVFSAWDGPERAVYSINADGTELQNLTSGYRDAAWPDISPDGNSIAFSAVDENARHIYRMSIEGADARQLTKHDGTFLAWAPDGNHIAFISFRDGRPRLYVMNEDGSHESRLLELDVKSAPPAWSPDGTRIAVATTQNRIVVVDLISKQYTEIADFGEAPDWSPDGQLIAYAGWAPGGVWSIFSTTPTGSPTHDLTPDHSDDARHPVWSPDGNRVAFVSHEGIHSSAIYVIDSDGLNKHRIGSNTGNWSPPVWSPDGQYIAFAANCDSNEAIYMAPIDAAEGRCISVGTLTDIALGGWTG